MLGAQNFTATVNNATCCSYRHWKLVNMYQVTPCSSEMGDPSEAIDNQMLAFYFKYLQSSASSYCKWQRG